MPVRQTPLAIAGACVIAALPAPARADLAPDAILAWQGLYSPDDTSDLLLRFPPSFEDSTVTVLGLGWTVAEPGPNTALEFEVNTGTHWGDQDHVEINAAPLVRWRTFPWDQGVDTSVAFGLGLSYAFEDPVLEAGKEGGPEQWLAYMAIEVTAALPQAPQWELVGRLHHRSGVFGTFGDVSGASEFLGLGVRYRISPAAAE